MVRNPRTLRRIRAVSGVAAIFGSVVAISLLAFMPVNSSQGGFRRDEGSARDIQRSKFHTGQEHFPTSNVNPERAARDTGEKPTNSAVTKPDTAPEAIPDAAAPSEVSVAIEEYPAAKANSAMDDAALARLHEDPATAFDDRAQAHWLRQLDSAKWRGHNGRKLGGFRFDPTAYPMLAEWECRTDPVSITRGTIPPVGVNQRFALASGDSLLTVRVVVCVSVAWAHHQLVDNLIARSTAPVVKIGDNLGVNIGDVWLGGPVVRYGPVASGGFIFARRNVAISLSLHRKERGNDRELDLMKLGEQIDRQIIAQGHDARQWSDLKDVCPLIAEFSVENNVLTPASNFTQPLRLDVRPREGMDLVYLQVVEHPLRAYVSVPVKDDGRRIEPAPRTWPESVALDTYAAKAELEKVESLETAAWLFVVDAKSLLFSVARLPLRVTR